MSKIFISYSHKDEKWKDKLIDHLKVLELEGYCTLWDDRNIKMGDDWFHEIDRALNEAQIAIMIISTHFLTSSFIRKEEIPRILERRLNEGLRVLPIIVKPCVWKTVQWLKSIQFVPKDAEPLSKFKEYEIDQILKNFTEHILSLIKPKVKKEQEIRFLPLPPENLSTFRMPTTGKYLFGRKKELNILDDAWADENTNIVTLVAWGGAGKTALVNHWLNLIERKNYCGANKVYCWSFHSQGAEEGKQVSADEFMQETLKWFGDPHPEEGIAVEKGRRLAWLVKEEKNLLILDGMEPLQYPPGDIHGAYGILKDQGMRAFLREFSSCNPGLCIITSRESVTDLEDKHEFTVNEIELDHLSEDAGAQLLKSMGAFGSERELRDAVNEYDGHALALTLLGKYIETVFKGDIRKRDKIPQLTTEISKGRYALRVMEAYERWFRKYHKWKFFKRLKVLCTPTPELNILYLMGLFDRPVEKGAINALIKKPSIKGLTSQLHKLSNKAYQDALKNLRTTYLLSRENPKNPDTLDCHPLIREHFGQKFKKQKPRSWKKAQERLYNYYKNLPQKELPDTLKEMEPLFVAVAHGCKAGLHEEVINDVYWKRIKQCKEHYDTRRLGAFGADLAALSYFFEVPWSRLASGLIEFNKGNVFLWTAFDLKTVGRIQEALQPAEVGLNTAIIKGSWEQASKCASMLSELMLMMGDINQAEGYARQSIIYANKTGSDFQRVSKLTILADVLHQAGKLDEAEELFKEAEDIQNYRQPQSPYLYSLWGFRYCDFLLSQGKYKEVMERAEHTLYSAVKKRSSLFSIALDKLTLGRVWMMQMVVNGSEDFSRAMYYLGQAVEGLRESGNQDDLPRGLLARAECYRRQKKFDKALDDLKEMEEIATLGSMKLYLVDYHLEAGVLCEAEGNSDKAKKHFKTAAKIIKETGYHRRDREVEKVSSR